MAKLKRIRLKQGTLAWENARANSIGSSEVFDIIRYYAKDNELQNCGLNAEHFKNEKPHTTVWALYHKMLNDGLYSKGILPPELAEYGHAMEAYGASVLQQGRELRLKSGEVYTSGRLIASLDISGVSEEIDERDFDYGDGKVRKGLQFVCEQKTIMPNVLKKGLPIKYVIQAQFQISLTQKDFFILQIMVLDNDTVFERGRITQLRQQSLKKMKEYLDGKVKVTHIYFANNPQLEALIKVCIKRFFKDVDDRNEPLPYLPYDSQKNIIESIRINSFYNKDMTHEFDLTEYIQAKELEAKAEQAKRNALQRIIERAKEYNVSKFISPNGDRASFSSSGAFLLKIEGG